MIDSIKTAPAFPITGLGLTASSCCPSFSMRMLRASGAYHPENQFETGPNGRSEQHDQASY